jgi:hypothetical protein
MMTGENRRTRRKTYPSVTLSTTNPTWIDLGANPGLRGEKPATNRLSTAYCYGNISRVGSYDGFTMQCKIIMLTVYIFSWVLNPSVTLYVPHFAMFSYKG